MSATPKGRAKLKAKGKKPMPADVAPDFMKISAKAKGRRKGKGGK